MQAPGNVRDAIVGYLASLGTDSTASQIHTSVEARLGPVPRSSVRSYLRLNTPRLFERTGRGRYKLTVSHGCFADQARSKGLPDPCFSDTLTKLYNADCFSWLAEQPKNCIHAVITDPPYGLLEYSDKEQEKLRSGRGGVWRIPPSFDGHQRAPLPRFTILDESEREKISSFFKVFAVLIRRVAVPGANVVIASNPLLAHLVAKAMSEGGLELRGYIARLVMTMRGGDRPKNAHQEFAGVSVMPRSMWEPWVVLRTPLEGRVQDNLRVWKTGGFRRPSDERPFGDVIRAPPASSIERKIAPHPSLKPQAMLRQLVRASLPLGEGIVLDPFAGSGSTLAAASAVGYASIGVEKSAEFAAMARRAIPALAALPIREPSIPI